MAGLTLLNDEQLRKLAKVIKYKEAEAIKNIQFKSEPERAKYLRDSKVNYESIVKLLDDGNELKQKFQNDKRLSPIAHDILSYVQWGANFAFQAVRIYPLRMKYLYKLGEHAKTLMNELRALNPAENATEVERLAEEATQCSNAMLEYTRKYKSPASRALSKWLSGSSLKIDDLVKSYQKKLKFDGPFNELEDAKKIQVYEEIIESSGRGKVITETRLLGIAGIAVLLLTAGIIVWDIFSSEHKLETAAHDTATTIASVGGVVIGQYVGVFLTSALVGTEATLFVVMTGFLTGIIGAFILEKFAGSLVDLLFGSGDSTILSTDGHRAYIAAMPDVKALANQITHHT